MTTDTVRAHLQDSAARVFTTLPGTNRRDEYLALISAINVVHGATLIDVISLSNSDGYDRITVAAQVRDIEHITTILNSFTATDSRLVDKLRYAYLPQLQAVLDLAQSAQ